MRTVALLAVFVVLAGVFCGGGGKSAVATASWPKESLGPLTEADIAQFVKIMPTLNAALKAGNWTMAQPKGDEGPDAWLIRYVGGMNVPGVDESLKTAGSNWSTMRAILYKVIPAMTAMKLDQTPPEMIEQMRKDTSAAAKEGLKRFEDTKAAFSQIPSANRQLVTAHLQELLVIQRLGR